MNRYTDDFVESLMARADALESTVAEQRVEFERRLGYWQERALEAEAKLREQARREQLGAIAPGPCEQRAIRAFGRAEQGEE